MPGGRAFCLGVGRPGSGALPSPTTRPFGCAARAHYRLAVGAGGAGAGTRHQPHSARSCELALRAVGAAQGCPGGCLLPGCGASGVRRFPIPNRPSFGACGRGRLPTGCGCGGWGRVDRSPTPQRALLCAGLARCGGGTRAPQGRAPPAWVWCVRGRALSHARPLVLSGVQPGSTTHLLWLRRVRALGLVNDPTARAPACWLGALWGRHEGARGGRLLPGCGVSGVRRSPTPDHSSFRACGQGPLPTGCGCGGCGRADPSPTPQRALLRAGFARCGGGMRVPRGGASCLGVGPSGSGALPAPTTRPFGRAAETHYPHAVGPGGAGLRTRHQPHSARFCEPALRAVGAAGGRPGGAPLAWVRGVRGRALFHPQPPVLWGVQPGPTTHWLWVWRVRAWGPITNPTARALACWLGALWGQHEGTRGGRLFPGCGASGVGRSPIPNHSSIRACGRGPLPTGCGCGGCGRGDPSSTPQRALLRAGLARCGRGMRVPVGGASCLGVGRPGSGALPAPTTRPFGRAAETHYPHAVGPGGAGLRTRHQPHSARFCEPALRAVGAAGGRPGGAPLAWVRGVRGRALFHPQPPVLWGVQPGPTTHWLGVWRVRAWGPITNPTARALACWLGALWG